jgi:hypothetical protein
MSSWMLLWKANLNVSKSLGTGVHTFPGASLNNRSDDMLVLKHENPLYGVE